MAYEDQHGIGDAISAFPAAPGFSSRRANIKPKLHAQSLRAQQANRLSKSELGLPNTQITPPLTPQVTQYSQTTTTSPPITYFEAAPDSFHNYMRAFHHFHPNSNVSSVNEESSITVPINQGDVILVHSIQPNGWADGTLLTSGARGWLPTNYCEAFDHDSIRTLLNALTYVWEFIRGHEDDDPTVYSRQDYVRGMIAGVRLFLEKSKCLTRDASLVQTHVGIRRMRKGLLADLSTFVKSAKVLQEVCQQPMAPEDLYEILDDIVLKAFKVVTRAVRFLDIWTQDVFLKQSSIGIGSAIGSACTIDGKFPPTPPSESLNSANTRHSSDEGAKSGDKNHAPLPSLDGQQTEDPGKLEPNKVQERRISTAFAPNFSRADVRPLSSVTQKRSSVSHRVSYCSKPSNVRKHALASERLSSTHDAFLGFLGAFIGLHLQSRSSMDLLITTQQSVAACQSLLAVVDEVWERDCRRSESLDEARDVMHAKLAELVQATRDMFKSSDSTDDVDTDVFMPDQGKRFVEAATVCVRSAGDCVAKAKSVIERIGDFDFEPVGLGISDEQPANGVANGSHNEDSTQSRAEALQATMEQLDSTLPPAKSPPPPPPPAEPSSPPPAPPSDKRISSTVTHLPPPTTISHSNSTSRSSFETVVPGPSLHRETKTQVVYTYSSLDLEIPPISPIDFPAPPQSAGPFRTEFNRPTSFGLSISDTNSSQMSSFRHSNTSVQSESSTQATSPEHSPVREKSEDECQDNGFGFQDNNPTLIEPAEPCEEVEALTLAKTFAHELTFNKEGQITGGSLPALVERLTTGDSTPDAMFVNTFYLTFRLFTTPTKFAQSLIDRFDHAGDDEKLATPVRLRVYNVFKGWLETHWRAEIDVEALPTMVQFSKGRLRECLCSASKRLLELIAKVSDGKDCGAVPRLVSCKGKTSTVIGASSVSDGPAPSPIISKSQLNMLRNAKNGQGSCSILDFDALELARQFTIIESKIFCSIQPEELLALEWTKKTDSKAVNVRAMSKLSTDLANLVADTILQLEEPKKRAVVIKQWVKIAKKCFELNNYDSLMAIICSLNSSMVLRLKRTWDLVAPKTLARLEELKGVVDVSKNYAVLRQRLQGHVPPCLPFVGIFLTDLTFVDVGNQMTRQLPGSSSGDCVTVINFDKHVKTAKIIGDLQRFQIPYKLSPIPEMQSWMEAQILRVREDEAANVQSYYRRSLLLEPRECSQQKQSPAESSFSSLSSTSTKDSAKEKFEFWSALHFPAGSKERIPT